MVVIGDVEELVPVLAPGFSSILPSLLEKSPELAGVDDDSILDGSEPIGDTRS